MDSFRTYISTKKLKSPCTGQIGHNRRYHRVRKPHLSLPLRGRGQLMRERGLARRGSTPAQIVAYCSRRAETVVIARVVCQDV